MFAFLLNLTRNEADTRDLLQELFVLQTGSAGPICFMTYARSVVFLIRLAHNQRHRPHAPPGNAGEKLRTTRGGNIQRVFVPIDADPDEQAFREALAKSLAELPPDQRAVVHLKLWERWTFEQIALWLEIPPNTAASRYRYGLDKLRDLLRPLYEEIK